MTGNINAANVNMGATTYNAPVEIGRNAEIGTGATDRADAEARANLEKLLTQLVEGLREQGTPAAQDAVIDAGRLRRELDDEHPDPPRLQQLMSRIRDAIGPVAGLAEIADRVGHLISVIVH